MYSIRDPEPVPHVHYSMRSFLVEGIWHIWHGYDHILFLITLLLPAVLLFRGGRWRARVSLRDSLRSRWRIRLL